MNDATNNEAAMNTNIIDITDLTEAELDELLGYTPDEPETFRCPGCADTVAKYEGWTDGMCCRDCVAPDYEGDGYYDDSWGDHNPYYDF